MLGVTGGYHRLWSHRTYKAGSILQLFYLFFGTMASQSSVINWSQHHRSHHRNEEKSGDPYNITKGLFHAHVGWLLFPADEKETAEIEKSDVSDLEANKLLVCQHEYYYIWWTIISFIIPYFIMKKWNETDINIFYSNFMRIVLCLNISWCINSFAHYSGTKPYNKNINASNNDFLGLLTLGEGWHNYHHSFPKDYRASEPGTLNFTTSFIDLTRILGLSSNHYYNDNTKIAVKNRFNTKFYKMR